MTDMVNISVANAGITAILGYLVVFVGLILLMLVVMLMGKIMVAQNKKAAAKAAAEPAPAAAKPAPGTAGELKLYDTDPRDAAMVMAIVADTLGKPLNELRFISIKEVKEDEI